MKVGKEIRLRAKKVTSNVTLKVISFLAATAILLMPLQVSLSTAQGAGTSVWWPAEGAHITGTQPFKAVLDGAAVESYEMFWQVDGGSWVWMDNNYTDAPHKEARVDVSGWNWRGAGPYKLNFIARQNGSIVAQREVSIYIDNGQPVAAQPASPLPVAQAMVQKVIPDTSFYVDPNSPAATQAAQWRHSRPSDAQKMDVLAAQPVAKWLGGWSGDVQSAVRNHVSAAKAAGKTAVFVAYNIPQRDCGGYSAGGTNDYLSWIGGVARGIGDAQALVVLEPDSLSLMDCLSQGDRNKRMELLSSAVSILKSNGNTRVYLDAGHSNWVASDQMAARLEKAGVSRADGFALNVSNFMPVGEETSYGTQISQRLGGKHFIIDTSRNGNGSNGEWCNPWGRSIGTKPTTDTGNGLIDAYLWLKTPGESDGSCNGGPSAGTWWPDYALHLVR